MFESLNVINDLYASGSKSALQIGAQDDDPEQSRKWPMNPIQLRASATELAYADGLRMRFLFTKVDQSRKSVEAELRKIESETSETKLLDVYSRALGVNSKDKSIAVVMRINRPSTNQIEVGERRQGSEPIYQQRGTYLLEFDLRFSAQSEKARDAATTVANSLLKLGLNLSSATYLYKDSSETAQTAALAKATAQALTRASAIAEANTAVLVLPAFSTSASYFDNTDQSETSAPRQAKTYASADSPPTQEEESQSAIFIQRPTPREVTAIVDVVYQSEKK